MREGEERRVLEREREEDQITHHVNSLPRMERDRAGELSVIVPILVKYLQNVATAIEKVTIIL